MPEKNYVVISGELAESKKVDREHLGKIPEIIRSVFHEVNERLLSRDKLVFEIIRMDEFLCLGEDPSHALHSALLLASVFRYRSYMDLGIRADLRLSIGIGPAELFNKQLRESDGTAFRLADENLTQMRRNQRLVINTINPEINAELRVGCSFLDIIIHDWSDEQAEAFYHRLSGLNQVKISELLRISQPAVNRRLKAAHYDVINVFLERYTQLLNRPPILTARET